MMDPTQRGDAVASVMRDYYEANKPLRWWQRRRRYESECADNLMIGLLNVALYEWDKEKTWPCNGDPEDGGGAMETEALRSALERLARNFDLLLAGKPVRDVAETRAEIRAALAIADRSALAPRRETGVARKGESGGAEGNRPSPSASQTG